MTLVRNLRQHISFNYQLSIIGINIKPCLIWLVGYSFNRKEEKDAEYISFVSTRDS